jgi:predicted amino acid racemase
LSTLLDKAVERNPGLIEAAFQLHQEGRLPSPTQVIDLDAIAKNAAIQAEAAGRLGLRVFAMTKQNGLNPFMTRIALDQGLHSTVAVETLQAHRMHRYGFPLGNVGHLQNVPAAQVARIVAMRPEYVTVYTLEAARRVSDAAAELGHEQDLYVRVTNPAILEGSKVVAADEGAFGGLIGGWTEANCVEGIRPLLDLPNVRVAGLTQFGGVAYQGNKSAAEARPTEALETTMRAKQTLEAELGLEDLHVNCGGNANATTFEMLADVGVTEVEPGLSICGAASFHATEDMPEIPAQAVVTEVSHFWEGDVYTVGGVFAFVSELYDQSPMQALVGSTADEGRERRLTYLYDEMVDAHGVFSADGFQPAIGDTVTMVHHPQGFLERGYTAAVSGISSGEPVVEGIFDSACHELDEDFEPVPLEQTMERLDAVAARYRESAAERIVS